LGIANIHAAGLSGGSLYQIPERFFAADDNRNTVHSQAYRTALNRFFASGSMVTVPEAGRRTMPDFYLPHARHKDSWNGAD